MKDVLPATLILILPFIFGLAGCEGERKSASNASGGVITALTGDVDCRPRASDLFRKAVVQDNLLSDGAVRTGKGGQATLLFPEGTAVSLAADAFFELRQAPLLGHHQAGTALFKVHKSKSEIIIQTPIGNTVVLGTTFAETVTSDTVTIWVQEGRVAFTNARGEKEIVKPHQKLIAQAGKKLVPATDVSAMEIFRTFGTPGKDLNLNRQ